MSIKKELKILSFVLLSKKPSQFNPSEFNLYWLDVHKIIPANTINSNSSFSPVVVQAFAENLTLIVTPDQIQVGPKSPELFKNIVTENLVSLVQNMSKVELNGLGLNFNWYLFDDNNGINELSRKYFFNSNNPATTFFSKDESLFGNYLSKQIDNDIRLKLDIKPAQLFDAISGKSNLCLQFAFNFHSDLQTENQNEKVLDIISKYDILEKITIDIMNFYN